MANETSKAMRRRWCEDAKGEFPWKDVFKGRILDAGCGKDVLPFPNVEPFDFPKDANRLHEYFPPNSFDLISASHLVEHLPVPHESMRLWAPLIKKGGHLCWVVPDVGAYENFQFPSVQNPDHKASFSMIYLGSVFPRHYHLPTLCKDMDDIYETLLCRYVEKNLDWHERPKRDLTWLENEGTEMWNEIVWRRR